MKASYKKETLPDPASEGHTYDNYTLQRDVEFCCDSLKGYYKKSSGWNYEQGKFVIVDQISYDGHTVIAIDFCPFCGEKIEYKDIDKPKKTRKQKK